MPKGKSPNSWKITIWLGLAWVLLLFAMAFAGTGAYVTIVPRTMPGKYLFCLDGKANNEALYAEFEGKLAEEVADRRLFTIAPLGGSPKIVTRSWLEEKTLNLDRRIVFYRLVPEVRHEGFYWMFTFMGSLTIQEEAPEEDILAYVSSTITPVQGKAENDPVAIRQGLALLAKSLLDKTSQQICWYQRWLWVATVCFLITTWLTWKKYKNIKQFEVDFAVCKSAMSTGNIMAAQQQLQKTYRLNPSDPRLYELFQEAIKKSEALRNVEKPAAEERKPNNDRLIAELKKYQQNGFWSWDELEKAKNKVPLDKSQQELWELKDWFAETRALCERLYDFPPHAYQLTCAQCTQPIGGKQWAWIRPIRPLAAPVVPVYHLDCLQKSGLTVSELPGLSAESAGVSFFAHLRKDEFGDYYLIQNNQGSYRLLHYLSTLASQLDKGDFEQRFQRAGRILETFHGRGVVKPTDLKQTERGHWYYTTAYVPSLTLRQVMTFRGKNHLLEEHKTGTLLYWLAQILQNFHAGEIVHRDIKPERILCATGVPALFLNGFFLLKCQQQDLSFTKTSGNATPIEMDGQPDQNMIDITMPYTALGAPAYVAPEQEINAVEAGPKADVWSWGTIAYELLTGVSYRKQEHPNVSAMSRYNPLEAISRSKLCEIVQAALQPDVTKRVTAAAIVQEMEKLAKDNNPGSCFSSQCPYKLDTV